MSKLSFYFNLAVFCLKLALNLFFFSLEILLNKTNKTAMLNSVLSALIIISLWSNFYIWQEKNTIQTKVQKSPSVFEQNQEKIVVEKMLLSREELLEKLNLYQEIEKAQIYNKATLLNLSQIYKILEEPELSQDYLSKANKI